MKGKSNADDLRINTKLMNLFANTIADSLASVINGAHDIRVSLSDLKYGEVVPLFKTGGGGR